MRIREPLVTGLLLLLPLPLRGTADQFQEEQANAGVTTVADYEKAVASATDPILQQLHERAQELLKGENDRKNSVIARAQGLFFAVALLTFLLTFGVSLVTAGTSLSILELFSIAGVSSLIVVEIILMTMNILRAITGLSYPVVSSKDMASWAKLTQTGWTRQETIHTMRAYRHASCMNTWRFNHLQRSVDALRNIVFTACALILIFFAIALWEKANGLTITPVDGDPERSIVNLRH